MVEYNRQADHWYLSENPSAYELKVLRNGQLARSVKFTLGANGIVQNGGRGNAANSKSIAIVPAKVWEQPMASGMPSPGKMELSTAIR